MYFFSVLNVPGAASWACQTGEALLYIKDAVEDMLGIQKETFSFLLSHHFHICGVLDIFRETTNDLLLTYVFYLLKCSIEMTRGAHCSFFF